MALRYQYKLEALRDQLRWEVIEGHIDGKSEAYKVLNCLLKTVQEHLPSLSLWTILGDQLVSKDDREDLEFRRKLGALKADRGCRDIYLEANALWKEYLKTRHRYSIWMVMQIVVPFAGLSQMCSSLDALKKSKRLKPGLIARITAG